MNNVYVNDLIFSNKIRKGLKMTYEQIKRIDSQILFNIIGTYLPT